MKTKKRNFTSRKGYFTIVAAFAMVFVSCGEKKNKQDAKVNSSKATESIKEKTTELADASFSDEMIGKLFENYQQIRMALVNSDAEEVRSAAKSLSQSFSDEQEDLKSTAIALASTDNLEKQRELFSDVTAKTEPLFKASISEGTLYKQFCPMAFEGKGGYWISNVEKIENPYYGDKMLKCGKVTEKIEK